MQNHRATASVFWLAGLICALTLGNVGTVRADLGFWSAHLVGTWRHPSNGDRYQFRSDATYTFFAGAAKRRNGNVSHSGFWKIVQPTAKESGGSPEGPVALRLNAHSRVVLEGKKPRVLRSNRIFRLVVDVTVIPKEDNLVDKKYYLINRTRWVRVR